MIEVKAEDVERSLFTHTALTDHNLDDPISPAAIYAQVSLTQTDAHTNRAHDQAVVTARLSPPAKNMIEPLSRF